MEQDAPSPWLHSPAKDKVVFQRVDVTAFIVKTRIGFNNLKKKEEKEKNIGRKLNIYWLLISNIWYILKTGFHINLSARTIIIPIYIQPMTSDIIIQLSFSCLQVAGLEILFSGWHDDIIDRRVSFKLIW